jgi:HAD superfamily hydrolase (TIGR01549 family)
MVRRGRLVSGRSAGADPAPPGGFWLGLAGNQTKNAGQILRELDLSVDLVATSDDWGVSKPDPAFFHRLSESVPFASNEILYVGDRLDNDIWPASRAGCRQR